MLPNTALTKYGAWWLLSFPSIWERERERFLPSKKEFFFLVFISRVQIFFICTPEILLKILQYFSKYLFVVMLLVSFITQINFSTPLLSFISMRNCPRVGTCSLKLLMDSFDTDTGSLGSTWRWVCRYHLRLWVCSLIGAATLVTHSWKHIYMANH